MANKTNTFNPVKEDTSGVKARRVIWSSAVLDAALTGIEQGKKLVSNPFYENNTHLLKGDLVFERTAEEIDEWIRCKCDIIYFVEKYCKLMTPEGIKNVKLRDYQQRYLKHLMDNRLSIYLACRQCGKTTTSAVFMLHYILFNTDKNALVLGNKRKTAIEILDKAKKIYLELPFFLKPGIYKWNEGEIVLDNGCRLMAEATTINSGISFTFHCVLADEFAHIQPNIIEKFYNNLFPTITAGKARFMITSTQNGRNLFYRLYKAAEAGESEYGHFKTDWNEVPEWNPETKCWEKRDEAWHTLQVANYGSEEAFNAQFGTNFDVSSATLISQKVLKRKYESVIDFIPKEIPGVSCSEYFLWHPDFDPLTLRREYITITCDLAEGVERDYTVFNFNRMIEPGSDKTECIGYFRANDIPREDCTLALQEIIVKLCNQNKTLLSWEKNTYGDLFHRQLVHNNENVSYLADFDQSVIVKYYTESKRNFTYGIKMTSGNKSNYCKLFKESFERNKHINDSYHLSVELGNFNNDGTGHYKAIYGHDDMVMSAVQMEFVKETLQYKLLKQEFDSDMEPVESEFEQYNAFEAFDTVDYYSGDQSNNASRLGSFYAS
jgi:hypothetical protein